MASPADADAATAEATRALYLEHCKAGSQLSHAGEVESARLAEVLKAHLRRLAEDLARRHPQQPALVSYISDATSFLCQSTTTGGIVGKVVRKGKLLEEFLMQRLYIHVLSPLGDRLAAVVVSEPKPLSKGKKATNLFSAGAKHFPMLRSFGRKGIVVFHLGADRAVFSALDRLFRQRQRAYYDPQLGPDLGDEASMLEKTDLYIATGCALHDISNAIQWGFASISGGEVLKDIHIVIESCRNSFVFIQANVIKFLVERLGFVQPPIDTELVLRFWRALGVDGDWLDILGYLNPWWDGNRLLISEAAKDDPDLIGKVSDLILYLWRWRKFVETRWVTIGPSCRALVASLCVGLEEVVAITLADKSTTNFNLHGFSRLTSDVKKYICIATIAAFPADALQLQVLDDDRVARRTEQLKQALADEVGWVEELDDFTWQRLAQVIDRKNSGMSPYDLRSAALTAVHVSCAYIHKKIFSVADELPWSLVAGDVSENLQRLADKGYDGDDPTVMKIVELLRLGYNRERLVEGVSLLRDVPWSTMTVEQAHGSLACIHRLHPTLSVGVLAHRAMIHQCRHMFHQPMEEREIARADQKAVALRKKMPQKIHAKQVFLRELMAGAKKQLLPGTKMSSELRQDIMRRHSELFKDLDPEAQHALELSAASHTAATKRCVTADLEHVKDHMALHRARLTQESLQRGLTNRVAEHRLPQASLLALARMLKSDDFLPGEVRLLRQRALEAPEAPSDEQLAAFAACHVPRQALAVPAVQIEWLRHACLRRDDYVGCALFAGGPTVGSEGYLFLYATQKPYEAMFLHIWLHQRHIAIAPTLADLLDSSACSVYQFNYRYAEPRYFWHSELPFDDLDGMFVLEDLRFDPSGHLCSDSRPVPWREFTRRLPVLTRPSNPDQPKRRRRSKAERADLMGKHPWLRMELQGQQSKPTKEGQEPEEDGDEEPEENGDDIIDLAMQAVYARQQLWAQEDLEKAEHFRTKVIAAETDNRSMNVFNRVQGVACGPDASVWCRTYGMNPQASFSHAGFSHLDASMMASEWCRRMQHFYSIYEVQGDPAYVYSADDLEAYMESEEWVSYLARLSIGSPAHSRSQAIRSLAPKLMLAAAVGGAASSSTSRRP